MSILIHNTNATPHAGQPPVLEGAPLPVPRPAAFSQPFVPQSGGPSEPPAFDFQIARSLRTNSKLAILVGLAACLLSVAFGWIQPRTYTASSVIYVEPMVARNLNEQGVPGFDQFRYGSFLDQQIETIVRPDVLTAALRTLPAGTWRGPLESEQAAVGRLAKALTVERVLTSYQIDVQLKASDPQAAAAIVNAVTKAYLQRGREDEFKQADLREQILGEERDRVKQELETDRKEQAGLGASMGLASPADGAANPYDADLANLRAQLATARQARDVAAAQLASVSGPDAVHQSGLAATADDAINTDPGLSAKKAAVNARRVVLESAMAGMTPGNPQYRQAEDEIADLDRALETKTVAVRSQSERRIQDKLRTDLQRTADVESRVNAQLAQATLKATGAGPKLQRAAELANDIQRLTAHYTTVDEALNALELETSGPGMAHVPLPAAIPLSPDPNHRNLFFLAALPLGFFLGISSAVIARMCDRRVYLATDLENAIGFSPIAVLPTRENNSQEAIEEYSLRFAAGVESAYRTAGAQSFVVTAVSADTEIGTLLRNLAAKLEGLRLRVLVLRASELLVTSQETMEHQAASAALLAGGSAPAGEPGDGIATAKLDRMKAQHDIILIDAAPVLHSAETEYAARCADATILIVESAVTRTPELAAATELLSRLRVTGVGAVLTEVKLDQAEERFRSAVRAIERRNLDAVFDRKSPERTPVQPAIRREPPAAEAPAVRPSPAETAPAGVVPAGATAVVADRIAPQPLRPVFLKPATESPQPRLAMPAPAVPVAAAQPHRTFAPPANETPVSAIPVASPAHLAKVVAAPVAQAPAPLHPAAPLPARLATGPAPKESEPAVDAAAPVMPAPPRIFARPPMPRRTFKNWTVSPEILPKDSERELAPPGVFKSFGPLADPAATASPALSSALSIPVAARPEAIERAAEPPAASATLPDRYGTGENRSKQPVAHAENDDDPHAIGRFIDEKDTIGAVPSYTRSKIRLAFKEQEVNSKTTWFSKLFRGDPPTTFRIVPDDAEQEDESPETPKQQWEKRPVRLPEPIADGDPALSHLLNRIKPSSEAGAAPRPQPVALEPEPVLAAGPPVPFLERRSAPRPVKMEEYTLLAGPDPSPISTPAEVFAPYAPAPVASPEVSRWKAMIAQSLTPPLPPAPASFAVPSAARASDPMTAPTVQSEGAGPSPYGRPLRPLTFQQLAGSMEAESPHEETQPVLEAPLLPTHPVIPARPVEGVPEQAAPITGSHVSADPAQSSSVASQSPMTQSTVSPDASSRELPPTPVPSASHTGMPMWPAKEPMVSSYAPQYRAAQYRPTPETEELAAAPAVRAEALEAVAPVPEEVASPQEQPLPIPEFLAPVPSARRATFERIPILADPLTDPSPAQRPYRFEPQSGAIQLASAPEPPAPPALPDLAPVATVPAGTSFPPDPEARQHLFARRRSDRNDDSDGAGLSRRWKLLSQFEPVLSDPLPAHRKAYSRSADIDAPQRNDEG